MLGNDMYDEANHWYVIGDGTADGLYANRPGTGIALQPSGGSTKHLGGTCLYLPWDSHDNHCPARASGSWGTSRHGAADQNAWAAEIVNAPLRASAGVYAYGSASVFPTQVWNGSNYWVDVVFAASAP